MKIKLVLDINKNLQAQLNAVVTGRQGDKVSNTVNVFVVDGGVPYNLTGQSIYYEGLKPNNAYVRDTSGVKIIDATQGNFEYTFIPETFGVAGVGKRSYFSIEQGGTVRASTQDFGLVTLADAMTGNSMSGPYISELELLIQEAQWLVDDINSRWTFINDQLYQLQNKLNTMDVVKRSGDTMTGHLILDRPNASTVLDTRWRTSGAEEILLGQDNAGNWRAYNYKLSKSFFVYVKDTDTFNINATNTNVVKKTEVYTNLVKSDGGCISISNTDLDNLKTPGFYSGFALGNAPAGLTGTFYIDVTLHTSTYIRQEATTATITPVQKFTRELINNVWSPWQKIAREDDVVTKVKDTTVNLPITSDFTPTTGAVQNIVRRGNTVTLMLDVTRNANSTSPIVTTIPDGLCPVGSLTTDVAATDGTMSRLLIRFNGEVHLDTIGKRYRILQTFVTV